MTTLACNVGTKSIGFKQNILLEKIYHRQQTCEQYLYLEPASNLNRTATQKQFMPTHL